eukprot:6181699-Pleurochrysis_carterae.AAC.2
MASSTAESALTASASFASASSLRCASKSSTPHLQSSRMGQERDTKLPLGAEASVQVRTRNSLGRCSYIPHYLGSRKAHRGD